jgi:hypothetical protein
MCAFTVLKGGGASGCNELHFFRDSEVMVVIGGFFDTLFRFWALLIVVVWYLMDEAHIDPSDYGKRDLKPRHVFHILYPDWRGQVCPYDWDEDDTANCQYEHVDERGMISWRRIDIPRYPDAG